MRETVHDCRMAERVGVSEGSDGRAGKTVDISYIRSARRRRWLSGLHVEPAVADVRQPIAVDSGFYKLFNVP